MTELDRFWRHEVNERGTSAALGPAAPGIEHSRRGLVPYLNGELTQLAQEMTALDFSKALLTVDF